METPHKFIIAELSRAFTKLNKYIVFTMQTYKKKKYVLILHIFLITMEKYENDKNDFLQTQRIRQLDKYSISIK